MGLFGPSIDTLKQRAEWLSSQTFVVLSISVPKDNDKTAASAEQFFAALHGIYRDNPIEQEHISFEIVARKDAITFYVFAPLHLRDFVEGQLYAQYPNLQIRQVPDYTKDIVLDGQHVAATIIKLTKEDVYPIKTFQSSDVDPLASITAVVLGGTSLTGGRGTFIGTVLGAVLLTEILSAVTFLSLTQTYQYLFQGILIVVAALIYSAVRGRTAS